MGFPRDDVANEEGGAFLLGDLEEGGLPPVPGAGVKLRSRLGGLRALDQGKMKFFVHERNPADDPGGRRGRRFGGAVTEAKAGATGEDEAKKDEREAPKGGLHRTKTTQIGAPDNLRLASGG